MRCYNCINSKYQKSEKDYECVRMAQCLMEDVEKREKYNDLNIKVGSRIRFKGEKHFWKVRARDERFLICTWRKFYTICDLYDCIRGKDNYIDCAYDYTECDKIDYREALYRLNMSDNKLLKDCINMPDDIRKHNLEVMNAFGEIPENEQWVENLEISYRNWVDLDIEEVKS